MVRISSFERILSTRAFWTFKILPRSGRMAWKLRSRPCFAEPPAESPSTRYSSHSLGSVREQSARDRKSTRLNSSHVRISYAVFCLKKKKNHTETADTTDHCR